MRAEARLSVLTEGMKDELREVTTSIVMNAKPCQDRLVLASRNADLRGRASKVSVESLNISGYYRTTVIT
jgi:hypothetical protein